MPSRGFLRLFAATLVLFSSLVATASADSTFTNQGSFLANVRPDYYLETFDGLNADPGGTYLGTDTLSFSQGGFAFTVFGRDGLYGAVPDLSQLGDSAISVADPGDLMTFFFTGKGVTAVGGNFFTSDLSGQAVAEDIFVRLSNGTLVTLTSSASDPQPFVGFTTSGAFITSLSLQPSKVFADTPDGFVEYFATANNLIIGSAATTVPEPSSATLLVLGLIGPLGAVGLRKRRRN